MRRADLPCSQESLYNFPHSTELIVLRNYSLKMLFLCRYISPDVTSCRLRKQTIYLIFLHLISILDCETLRCPDLKIMVSGDFNNFDSSSILGDLFAFYNCFKSPTHLNSIPDEIWISTNLLTLTRLRPLNVSQWLTVGAKIQNGCQLAKILGLCNVYIPERNTS